MGKRSKSMRHVEKMKARRSAKAARATAYETMAAKGNNSKKKFGSGFKKPLVRIRDLNCKNIGDIVSFPVEVAATLSRFDRDSYGGKYKHQLAYERMKTGMDGGWVKPVSLERWLDTPIKDHLGRKTNRRAHINVF